jgi:hypothetical protein
MTPSQITLCTPPFPSAFSEQIAIIKSLAFAGDPVDRWVTVDPIVFVSSEDIPRERLQHRMLHDTFTQLRPDTVFVVALLDNQVAGYAVWELPRKYHRSESLAQFLYRKAIGYKISIIEWFSPIHWERTDRLAFLSRLRRETQFRISEKSSR